MKITDFDIYKDLLKEKSGLVLTQDKSYLVESRLNPVAKKWGYDSLDTMTMALQGVPDKDLVRDIVEAMTTNETSFFRDSRPFDLFKDVVIKYMKEARAPRRRLRIWCAAASSGQEPYTIAMLLKEAAMEFPGWSFEIIATDISHDILNLAREGRYTQFEVQRGLPIQLLMKYFTQDGDRWQLNDEIRKMVKYDYFNLLDPMAKLGTFDIIFCRNVLIYFDEQTKGMVLDKMAQQIEKDGFLFLGGAETVLGITNSFKPIPDRRGLYAVEGSPLLKISQTDTQALA
ncbi:MAG: protein-glutamate O-methyltransferase CheR [Alphaproteobacteria bacterium]|nr:protein-glutamate O-methyltransferase CheR [Alphaproteobacteria bacterium]